MPRLQNRPAEIKLPHGWDWDRVEAQRAKWSIAEHMIPVATIPGACVAWCTIDSVRADIVWEAWLARVESESGLDVINIERAYIAFHNGQTASDYALEVVARAAETAGA
jgi:hypothetical protein